jgi:hypothetical protein
MMVLRIFFSLFSPRWRGCSNVTFYSQFPQHLYHFLVRVHVLQDLMHHHLAVGSSAPASISYLHLTPIHIESNSLCSWCKLISWCADYSRLCHFFGVRQHFSWPILDLALPTLPCPVQRAHQAADCHGCLRLGAGSSRASLYQVSSTQDLVLYNYKLESLDQNFPIYIYVGVQKCTYPTVSANRQKHRGNYSNAAIVFPGIKGILRRKLRWVKKLVSINSSFITV